MTTMQRRCARIGVVWYTLIWVLSRNAPVGDSPRSPDPARCKPARAHSAVVRKGDRDTLLRVWDVPVHAKGRVFNHKADLPYDD